jgi:hypothetical protein
MGHSGYLASPSYCYSSHGYGLFEAKIPSEKMLLITAYGGAECELGASLYGQLEIQEMGN